MLDIKMSGKLFLAVVIGIVVCGISLSFCAEILSVFWMGIVQYAVIFIIAMFFFRMSKNKGVCFFGFRKLKIHLIPLVVLYGILIVPITVLIAGIFNNIFYNPIELSYGSVSDWEIVISSLVVAPLLEEMIFRGAILNGLKTNYGIRKSIFISSLLFALYHCNITQFFYTFVCGVLFALVAETSGSIWASIITHFMFNFAGIYGDVFLDYFYNNVIKEMLSINTNTFLILSILIWFVLAVLLFILSFKVLKKIKMSGESKGVRVHRDGYFSKKSLMPLSMVTGIVICCIIITIGLISNYLGILG